MDRCALVAGVGPWKRRQSVSLLSIIVYGYIYEGTPPVR